MTQYSSPDAKARILPYACPEPASIFPSGVRQFVGRLKNPLPSCAQYMTSARCLATCTSPLAGQSDKTESALVVAVAAGEVNLQHPRVVGWNGQLPHKNQNPEMWNLKFLPSFPKVLHSLHLVSGNSLRTSSWALSFPKVVRAHCRQSRLQIRNLSRRNRRRFQHASSEAKRHCLQWSEEHLCC